jgi:hypothetical protein
LQIYSMIKIAVTPEVNAVSTLLMLLTLAMVLVASRAWTRASCGAGGAVAVGASHRLDIDRGYPGVPTGVERSL